MHWQNRQHLKRCAQIHCVKSPSIIVAKPHLTTFSRKCSDVSHSLREQGRLSSWFFPMFVSTHLEIILKLDSYKVHSSTELDEIKFTKTSEPHFKVLRNSEFCYYNLWRILLTAQNSYIQAKRYCILKYRVSAIKWVSTQDFNFFFSKAQIGTCKPKLRIKLLLDIEGRFILGFKSEVLTTLIFCLIVPELQNKRHSSAIFEMCHVMLLLPSCNMSM